LGVGVDKVHWGRRGWEQRGCAWRGRHRTRFPGSRTGEARRGHFCPAVALLAILLLTTAIAASSAQAAAAADSRQIAADILSSSRYQTKLPGEAADSGLLPGVGQGKGNPSSGPQSNDDGNPPAGGNPSNDGDQSDSGPNQSVFSAITHAASPAVVTLLRYLPTVLLAGLVIAVVVFGIWRFLNRRRATTAEETTPVLPATAQVPVKPAPLAAWQKLAEQGRFDEAIHLLLLQALHHLRQERAIALQESQTSREILRGGDLQPQRRAGLATMIGAVEFCHFGGRPAGAQLFEHCLAAYQQIMAKTVEDVRSA